MKAQLLFVTCVCLLIGLAVAFAQPQTGGIRARVPFDFTVSGKVLAAGDYTVAASPLGVAVQDENGNVMAMALASEISGRPATASGQIVFHCYSDRCFLSEVWSPNGHSGRQLLPSGIEAEVARVQSQTEFVVPGR